MARFTVDEIEIHVPVINLNTQSLNILINELTTKYLEFSCGRIEVARNDSPIVIIESTQFSRDVLSLENPAVVVGTSLILDIGILVRFLKPYLIENEKAHNGYFRKLVIVQATKLQLTLSLSMAHVYEFVGERAALSDMRLSVAKVSCEILSPEAKYLLFEGGLMELRFDQPYFTIEAQYGTLFLRYDFPQAAFFEDTFMIINAIEKHFRGLRTSLRDRQPPTRRDFSIKIRQAHVVMSVPPLELTIDRSLEAHRAALHALVIRQSAAIEALSSAGFDCFNTDEFTAASQAMLFRLFREAREALPNEEKPIFSWDTDDLFLRLNGPAVHSKVVAVEMMQEIIPNIDGSDFSKISGGLLEVSGTTSRFRTPKLGDLFSFEHFRAEGFFFVTKMKPRTRSDIYHLKIDCDDGRCEFKFPQISAKSTMFIKLRGEASQLNGKWTPALLEFFQDLAMNTREFAKKKVPCGRLNFYDQCRLRLNVLLDLDLPETILGCQHNYTAYEPILFSTMRIVKGHLTLKDGIFHAIADNLTLEVHHHEHLETLASFPKPEVEVQFVSTNPQDPNRIRPLFIPVDSYRMWDSHYDPYADIRARHYTCEFIFWSHSVGMIDLDMFLNALQQFHSARERFAGFAVPPRFIKSPTSPIFGGLSGRFRLPNLTFTLNRGNISGQIAPDEAFLDRYIEIRWERLSKSISVDATFPLILTLNSNRDSRLDAHLTSFRLSPLSDNGGMSCELGDLTAEISISLLEHLKDVKFPTLTKKVMREIVSSEKAPSPKTPERLAVVFDRKKRDFSVNSVRLEIKSSHRITASVDRIGIEMRMNSFSSVCYFCSVESAGVAFNSPLVSATQLRITYVSTSNYQIALADIEQLSVDFRQEDIEVIRLLTFNLKENVFSLLPVRKHEPHVRDVLMTVKIATGLTTLHIGDPFLELRFAELDIKMNNEPDQQRRFSIQLVKAEVTNWREKDLYRKMLEKLDNAPHLFVCEIIQAPPVFKIPVLKKVKVTVQAVIAIRIPQKADLVEPVRSLLTPLLELVDRVKTSVIDESKERSGEVQDSPEVRKSSAAQLFCQAIELRIGMVKLWKKPLPVCMEFGPPVIAKQDVYGSWKSLGVKALGWVMQGALKISPKS